MRRIQSRTPPSLISIRSPKASTVPSWSTAASASSIRTGTSWRAHRHRDRSCGREPGRRSVLQLAERHGHGRIRAVARMAAARVSVPSASSWMAAAAATARASMCISTSSMRPTDSCWPRISATRSVGATSVDRSHQLLRRAQAARAVGHHLRQPAALRRRLRERWRGVHARRQRDDHQRSARCRRDYGCWAAPVSLLRAEGPTRRVTLASRRRGPAVFRLRPC